MQRNTLENEKMCKWGKCGDVKMKNSRDVIIITEEMLFEVFR